MPTKKTLHARWRSEFKLGQINSEDECSVQGSHNVSEDTNSESFTGKVIGTIKKDPVTKKLEISIPKK